MPSLMRNVVLLHWLFNISPTGTQISRGFKVHLLRLELCAMYRICCCIILYAYNNLVVLQQSMQHFCCNVSPS